MEDTSISDLINRLDDLGYPKLAVRDLVRFCVGACGSKERAKIVNKSSQVDIQEEDLSAEQPSPDVCRAAEHLAEALLCSLPAAGAVHEALQVVLQVSSNKSTQLDESLARLDIALGGESRSKHTRLQLLERLTAYVQACRLIAHSEAAQAPAPAADEAAQALIDIGSLVDAHADGSTAKELLDDINERLEHLLLRLPPGHFDPLVPAESLSPEQLKSLEVIYEAMLREYTVRRRMLLERAKVTLQSFLWTDWLKEQQTAQQAEEAAARSQAAMSHEPAVTLEHVFQACIGDVAAVMSGPTSGDKSRLESSVKKVIIGQVPDRGGRCEGRDASGNMPEWAPRTTSSGRGANDTKAGEDKSKAASNRVQGRGGNRKKAGGGSKGS